MMISIITGNLCCIKIKTRTAKVTICIISKDCSIALDSYRTPQFGDALHPAQSIVVTHRHPRMNVKAVSVTKTIYRDPKLLKGHRRRTAGGRWVAAQKPP